MDLIANPTFFILILVAAFFYYRRNRAIPKKKSFAGRERFVPYKKSFAASEPFGSGSQSYAIGEGFERYVQDVLFHNRDFILVEKTHNYAENSHRYVESSLKPDFTFRPRYGGEQFYVEAKYRSKYYDIVQWCKPYQLDRYKQIDKHTTVYIAIGIGGSPNAPKYVYVIPLSALDYNTFEPYYFEKYRYRTGYSFQLS